VGIGGSADDHYCGSAAAATTTAKIDGIGGNIVGYAIVDGTNL